jgi:hypothetical protein
MKREAILFSQDYRDIYSAALLSRHVYPERVGGELERELDLSDAGIVEVRQISDHNNGTFATAYVSDDTVFICVRGTESLLSFAGLRDWLTNLLGFKWKFYGIRAHFGFGSAAASIFPDVCRVIDLYRGRRIVFSGHSLGGAVAALLCVAMVHVRREACQSADDISLITFGQPRVTTRRQLRLALLGVRYIRVQNGSDAISGLPPPIAYGHAGINLYFPNDDKRQGFSVVNPSYLSRLGDRLFTFWERIGDHSSSAFVEKARALLAAHCPEVVEDLAVKRAKILTRG